MNELSENITPDLLVAYLNKELKQEEIILVEEWIAFSDENRREFESLQKIWEASGDPMPFEYTPDSRAAWASLSARITQWEQQKESGAITAVFSYQRFILRAAAVLIPLLLAGFYLFDYFNKPRIQQLASGNTMIHQELPDGSSVQLNKGTILEFPDKFKGKQRKVSLKGEAWFKIAKNPAIPFIINAEGMFVKVVGTEFDVRAPENSDTLSVFVKSGKVIVYAGNIDTPVDSLVLGPADKGMLVKTARRLIKISESDENEVFWITRTLVFRKTPLREVFATVEKAYQINIVIHQPGIEELLLTTTFTELPAEQVLQIIAESFNLDIRQDNNHFDVYVPKE